MTRTIRLTAAAMGLLAAGVSVGLAARPAAPPADKYDPQDDVIAATIATSKVERIKKPAELAKYMDDRCTAGIARPQELFRAKAALYRAKTEVAATDAEKLAAMKVALEAMKQADQAMFSYAQRCVVGGPGHPDAQAYLTFRIEAINGISELEIAVIELEEKLRHQSKVGQPVAIPIGARVK